MANPLIRPMTPFQEAVAEALVPKAMPADPSWQDEAAAWRAREARWASSTALHAPDQPQLLLPIFTAIVGTGGITIAGVFVSYASVLAGLASTALTIGLQYLLAPRPPKPEDGRVPIAQPTPYIFFGYGECRWAGAMMCWEAKGPRMHMVQALMGHRSQGNAAGNGFVEYWLHDDKVTLGGTGGDEPQPLDYDTYRYVTDTRIQSRLGADPETPYALAVDELSAAGLWGSDYRGDGQTSAYMRVFQGSSKNYARKYPHGVPQLSVTGRWAFCWDFRDPDQHPLDPSTWVWTKNAMVQLAHHLFFNPYGERLDFRRGVLPVLDMWKEEADVCDEGVPLAVGGTEPRYEASGVGSTEQGPKAATNALLAAMDGWICRRGDGAILPVAGKYREKYRVTITDADVIGHRLQHNVLFADEINQLTPFFNYPATGYTTTPTDFFVDNDAQMKAGRPLPQEARYDWVTSWRQARRLGKRDWTRIQQKVSGQIYLNLSGINAAYARWIYIDAPVMLPSLTGKTVENRKSTIDLARGGFAIDIAKMPDNPADIDAWNPATDEGQIPYVPPRMGPDVIPTPTIDTIIAVSKGGSVYLRVFVNDPDDEALEPAVRWRTADVGSGAGSWSEQKYPDAVPSAGLYALDTAIVPGDTLIDVEAVFYGKDDKHGEYSITEQIVSTVHVAAPVALLDTSAVNGDNQYGARFTTDVDPNVAKVAVYKVPAGVTLNKVTHLVATPAVGPGVVYAPNYVSGPGLFDLYYEPKNESNVVGPLAGPFEDVRVNFRDAFTRADENLDANANWTRSGGAAADVQVVSNELHSVTVSNALWLSPDVGVADQFVQAKFVAGATSSVSASVAMRVTDANNMILFRRNTSAQLVVQKRVGGTGTSLYTAARTPGDVVRLEVVGNNLDVYVNGAHAAGPLDVSDVPASNRAGIWNNGVAAATPFIDDYVNGPLV